MPGQEIITDHAVIRPAGPRADNPLADPEDQLDMSGTMRGAIRMLQTALACGALLTSWSRKAGFVGSGKTERCRAARGLSICWPGPLHAVGRSALRTPRPSAWSGHTVCSWSLLGRLSTDARKLLRYWVLSTP